MPLASPAKFNYGSTKQAGHKLIELILLKWVISFLPNISHGLALIGRKDHPPVNHVASLQCQGTTSKPAGTNQLIGTVVELCRLDIHSLAEIDN